MRSDRRPAPAASPSEEGRSTHRPSEAWFVLDGPLNVSPRHWKGWAAIGLLGLVLTAIILGADQTAKRLPSSAAPDLAATVLAAMFLSFGVFRLWTDRRTRRGARERRLSRS